MFVDAKWRKHWRTNRNNNNPLFISEQQHSSTLLGVDTIRTGSYLAPTTSTNPGTATRANIQKEEKRMQFDGRSRPTNPGTATRARKQEEKRITKGEGHDGCFCQEARVITEKQHWQQLPHTVVASKAWNAAREWWVLSYLHITCKGRLIDGCRKIGE